jgi:hypothetical protein
MNPRVIFSTVFLVVASIFAALNFSSCTKGGCYDKELKEQFENTQCPQDCPGVIGCDGKTYCNDCTANQQGIRT